MKESFSRKVFNVLNILFLISLSVTMFLPFVNIIAKSFSGKSAIEKGLVTLLPVDFSLDSYSLVIADQGVRNAFMVTVFLAVVGTIVNMLMTSLLAYPLSKEEFLPKKICVSMILFTFIFTTPLIPLFLLVRSLGLYNSIWALILPGAIHTFNFFVLRTFFIDFPSELVDSARIDGCGEMRILFQMVIPLSKPVLATLSLFYMVSHWNSYFNAIIYIKSPNLLPLQVKIRNLLVEDSGDTIPSTLMIHYSLEGIKMATIILATIPILLAYPFLQKYFVKGLQLGSLKG